MIIWKTGDIFTTECNTIVNTVNCEGVMGKGIAKQFKDKYKSSLMFKCYQYACKYWTGKNIHDALLSNGGDIYFWYNVKVDEDQKWNLFQNQFNELMKIKDEGIPKHHVLHFATKEFWRNPSKLEWIERGLYNFAEKDYEWRGEHFKFWNMGPDTWVEGMKTIAWPKLGCTNGGLDWENQVKSLMIKYLDPLPITCEIYE